MKKFRPFLALLLACWLLAVPALADDHVDRDTGESPPASDSLENDSPPFSEETPSESEALPDASENTPGISDFAPVDPETPADPLPENPVPETPVVDPDPLPVYPIPDTSVISPGFQEVPGVIYDSGTDAAPAAENHQVFTIAAIPEFALTALDSGVENTMIQVVRDLFGTYTPRVQTITTYVDGEAVSVENQYVPGVAGMDWEWIAGFTVFLLMLYCLFRLLGGAVKYG